MQTAVTGNLASTPSAQVFVAQEDLVLYAALIGRKPMSKTLRESIAEEPVMMTPVAAPPPSAMHHLASDARHRISVWVHDKLLDGHTAGEARQRVSGWIHGVS